jgi:ribosomal protein L37AE/L43A
VTTSAAGPSNQERQAVMHCPYCAEETLFPREGGGWECRSCLRAFSVTFLGLVTGRRAGQEAPMSDKTTTEVAP